MAEKETNLDACRPRERACVHTGKIVDSCLDKDCIEDIRVYLTKDSQAALENSTSTKARSAELADVLLDVQPVTFNRGYYSIDITYYYKIIADAVISGTRPVTIYGLAVFAKRVVLCGGELASQVYSSRSVPASVPNAGRILPEAVLEAVDPMLLSSRVIDVCDAPRCPQDVVDIPSAIQGVFDSELVLSGERRRLYVTLGQFSIVRLERDTQLTVPCYDYCLPQKECCDDPGCEESPCEVFGRIAFPVDAFYPTDCSQTVPGCDC